MNDEKRPSIYDLSFDDLRRQTASWGFTPDEARAVWRQLYRDAAPAFAAMTTAPPQLRARLAAAYALDVPQVLAQTEAPDGGTRKDLLQLADGEQVEVVLLRYRRRRIACISTQVGCACGCRFCATGQMGFARQLTAGEIVAQALHLQRDLRARDRSLTNLVLMGMGEPLLNYDATIQAVRRLLDPRGLRLPPSRVTLSTVGIPAGIRRLAEERLHINLAISLHAATDDVRTRLLPINARHPLDDLFAAVRAYAEQTGRRVMFEWLLVGGVTDTPAQAEVLVARLAGLDAHVNLIKLNPTAAYDAAPSTPEALAAFTAILDRAQIPHTVRQRRGDEIAAGCGQLRSRQKTHPCEGCGKSS
ncbi:MAG: 23S rRNA (adenine(2503)-C(2))-methyltransferase RlmN [Anaerolineales bacterium]